MDFSTLLLAVAILGCPIGMGIMMWMMNKQMGGQHNQAVSEDQLPADPAARLVALREQRAALEAEIAETTQVAELETRREALVNDRPAVPYKGRR